MSHDSQIEVRRTVKGAASLPYERMAAHILGPRYSLSLTLCGDALARRMYRRYREPALRQKEPRTTYASNVLSFPYAKDEGEIFLNVRKAEREAKQLGIPAKKRIALLLVHGCFHLKGHLHGDTMEGLERDVLRKFSLL
jgi:rRNA maturation RNase YbeY